MTSGSDGTGLHESENVRLRAQIVALEQRLNQQVQRTEAILQATLEGYHTVGLDGTILDCNDAFARGLGYTQSELRGAHIAELDPKPREELQAAIARTINLQSKRFISKHRHKDGHFIDVEINSHFVQIGEDRFLTASSHPITEQLQREQEIREREQKFRAIFDHTSLFISLVTAAGILLECNRTMLDFIGSGRATIEGRSIWAADFWDPANRDTIEACTRKAALGDPASCEVTLHSTLAGKLGGAVTLHLRIKPILNESGQSVLLIAEGYDVSELRRAEAERASLKEQVIAAQSAMIGELSTPLIPLHAGVVVMPLIGTLDRERGEHLLSRLLEGVVAYRASVAILDVTGVPTVDTEVANTLVRAARAVRLIGASVILTGIRPEVAQTLVQLDVDLKGITILASLAAGLDHARQRTSR